MWWRGYERTSTSLCYTKTRVCWRITQGCCSKGEDGETVLTPYLFQLFIGSKCVSVSSGHTWGKRCPPAALGSRSQSLHLQSNSIKSRPAANKPWQILSFEIHFGTAVVPSKRRLGGAERGKPAVGVMYAECLHVLDDSDTNACHRRHQFYLVTALQGNPYDCSAVRTLLIVIYLSGVIMLSREWQKRKKNGRSPKSGKETGSAEHLFLTIWPVPTSEFSFYLFSHATPVSLCGWPVCCQTHSLCDRHNKD